MPVEKITPDMFSNFKNIPGFSGPYRNQYLKGIALGPGQKKFETLDEAVKAANLNPRCGGITVSRQGYYTLRRKSNLYNSDLHNKFKSIEVSYVKNEDSVIPKPEKIITEVEDYEIIEVEKISSKINPECILEIIKMKNQEYYYNISTRKIYSLNGELKGELKRGKFINSK